MLEDLVMENVSGRKITIEVNLSGTGVNWFSERTICLRTATWISGDRIKLCTLKANFKNAKLQSWKFFIWSALTNNTIFVSVEINLPAIN
jgi:hypothetical protein